MRAADGGEAVRDGDCCAADGRRAQRFPHSRFGLGVERRRGLVEQQQGRVVRDGPRDGDPLLLAAAEVLASLSNLRLVLIRQLLDKAVRERHLCRRDGDGDLVARRDRRFIERGPCCLAAVQDVLRNSPRHQHRLLCHDAQRARAQPFRRERPDGNAIEKHGTRVRLVQRVDQREDGALARATRAHERRELAGPRDEGDAVEGGAVSGPRGVGKENVPQLHEPNRPRRQRRRRQRYVEAEERRAEL
mmetsp:Transcript_18513/g.62462  ORF Transcript_18513/g.62462 Transcript_18513/m.62462 type:complete len:246 (-) Transcript_18513:1254-1991(-)